MAHYFTACGQCIRELREAHPSLHKQEALAAAVGMSVRHLGRMERRNQRTRRTLLDRIAACLGAGVGDLVFSTGGPALASNRVTLSRLVPIVLPDVETVPRMTTVRLEPADARGLVDACNRADRLVPHLLMSLEPDLQDMADELFGLLDNMIRRRLAWALGEPPAERHDFTDDPDASRLARIRELVVLLKGNDMRVIFGTEFFFFPDGEVSQVHNCRFETHFVAAIAPPRGEYDEVEVIVPFDQGREFVIDWRKLPFSDNSPAPAA